MALAINTAYATGNTVTAANLNALVTEAGDGAASFNASLADVDFVVNQDTGVAFSVQKVGGQEEVVVNDGQHNTDFRVESDTNANLIHCDASASTVGIGGAAEGTGAYDLMVTGQMKIAGDSGTELVVQDNSAIAVQIIDGTTGSSSHVRSAAGNATLTLDTDVAASSTDNAWIFRNTGTTCTIVVGDYFDNGAGSAGYADEKIAISIDNATGYVSLNRLPTSDPTVSGRLWRDGTDLKVSTG